MNYSDSYTDTCKASCKQYTSYTSCCMCNMLQSFLIESESDTEFCTQLSFPCFIHHRPYANTPPTHPSPSLFKEKNGKLINYWQIIIFKTFLHFINFSFLAFEFFPQLEDGRQYYISKVLSAWCVANMHCITF